MSKRYIVEPQKDTFGECPDHLDPLSTWYVTCPEEEAEIFAVIDTADDSLMCDFITILAAQQYADTLNGE